MSTLVREDYTRCKVSARIRADLVQAACTKTVSQIQVSGCKKHVCGCHRCAKRRTGLVFYRLTCTSSAVRTVPKGALDTILRPEEPPFVWRLYKKTALRGSESTPCTNRCKPDTSKFKVFQVPGLRSTVLQFSRAESSAPRPSFMSTVASRLCSTLGAEYVDRFICCQRERES